MAKDTSVAKKKGGQMDWLYSSPASQVDREQYLLGKKIDRQVDPLLASEDRERQALASGPGALFAGCDSVNSTADMAVKVKEDPLFLIKKKEEEARKQLMSNPVKMKQLQQLLAQENSSKRKSKKRKKDRSRSPHRRSKKSHKDRRERSPSPLPSPPSTKHQAPRAYKSPVPPRKARPHSSALTQEELERRREEMMADAESHSRQREQRLRRLEQDHRREEEESSTTHSQDFLQPLRVQSVAAAGSVQERIQRSIGSVQRTHAALDRHFLHK
jgi:hypothetical protein